MENDNYVMNIDCNIIINIKDLLREYNEYCKKYHDDSKNDFKKLFNNVIYQYIYNKNFEIDYFEINDGYDVLEKYCIENK